MSKLMTGVSGVRGIYGESLTPPVVMQYVARFALMQKQEHGCGKIVVGRDSRTTGLAVFHSIVSTLISLRMDVVDIGIASTPTVLLTIELTDAI
ncbi:MAG TPA: phosphoglucosamine mutase, partial [Candidatus Cloacimonadota bacterium]|nr:phosphoglucosamine mutase [Candidatus Cloacimonadota bacterium]